jgi:hypothetical protein
VIRSEYLRVLRVTMQSIPNYLKDFIGVKIESWTVKLQKPSLFRWTRNLY